MTQIGGRNGRGRAAIGLKSPMVPPRMPKAMLISSSVLSACLVLSGCGGSTTTEPVAGNSGNNASVYGQEQPEELDTAVRHSPEAIHDDGDVRTAPARQNSTGGAGSPADTRSAVNADSPAGPGSATVSKPPARPDSTTVNGPPDGSDGGSNPSSAADSPDDPGPSSVPGSSGHGMAPVPDSSGPGPATAPGSRTGTGFGSFATLEDACEAISGQMLSIAFAPLTYSYGGGRAEAKQAVSELPELRQKVPVGLRDDFARIEALFAASGGDYSKVDSNAFQRAMDPVEAWVSGNCPGL